LAVELGQLDPLGLRAHCQDGRPALRFVSAQSQATDQPQGDDAHHGTHREAHGKVAPMLIREADAGGRSHGDGEHRRAQPEPAEVRPQAPRDEDSDADRDDREGGRGHGVRVRGDGHQDRCRANHAGGEDETGEFGTPRPPSSNILPDRQGQNSQRPVHESRQSSVVRIEDGNCRTDQRSESGEEERAGGQ